MDSNYIIETKDLSFSIGRTDILKNVSLSVPRGSIYGFLGPNGAGKTTLIRILLNLYNDIRGDVSLFGLDVKKNRVKILSRVGRFVEHPSLYAHLTGRENIFIACKYYGVPVENVDEVIKTVGMKNYCDRLVKTYSLGMKQRIAIAQALVHNPELLILDEPTNGLDPSGIREIRDLLIKLNKEYGKTIFISSHLLSEIEKMCDYVGVIDHGRILYQGELEHLSVKQSQSMEITVSNPELAQKLLTRQGLEAAHNHNSTLSFISENQSQTAAVNRLMIENGIEVYRLTQSHNNLEEVFMELTTQI